jgi:hypothetical protein
MARFALVTPVVAVAAASGACAHSYTAIGYDVAHTSTGDVAPMASENRGTSGRTALGFTAGRAALEVVVVGRDLETTVDPWITGSAGLELSLTLVRHGPVHAFAHGGPMRGLLFDASTLATVWGAGLGYGAGVALGAGGVQLVVDARGEQQWFAGTESMSTVGPCAMRTLSVGLRLGR